MDCFWGMRCAGNFAACGRRPTLSMAARRRKVHSTPFPPDSENCVRSLAPPLPGKPASLGFAGSNEGLDKTPPGTAPNEHFVLIVAFPRTPLRGTRTCQVLQCFRRAKFEWLSAVQSGPLGPGYTKILTAVLSELRLALPSQHSWCASWREPQGAPLRKTEAVLLLS